ncbi:hypothetical protein [Falsirhodobacter sp. 1013]|uniref:hypothetical protein n=1 Tax=Falsirhodobacter sp. 1013 TaxID=3417566 RepID=UPI003EB8757B
MKVRRDGSGLSEAFFTFSYSPAVDEEGVVGGIMDTVIETTDRVRFERKAAIIRQIARQASFVEDYRDKLVRRITDMGHAQDVLSLRDSGEATVGEAHA